VDRLCVKSSVVESVGASWPKDRFILNSAGRDSTVYREGDGETGSTSDIVGAKRDRLSKDECKQRLLSQQKSSTEMPNRISSTVGGVGLGINP